MKNLHFGYKTNCLSTGKTFHNYQASVHLTHRHSSTATLNDSNLAIENSFNFLRTSDMMTRNYNV